MRFSWLILFVAALIVVIFRADSLLSSACNNALFVSLSQNLLLQSQGQSALGMITAEEWEEQPKIGAFRPDFCFQEASRFGQGLSALWQREWELADRTFEASDRGFLTDMGSYATRFILDEEDRTMSASTADYFLLKGEQFLRLGRPELAGVYFQESVNSYPSITGWLGVARAYREQGLLDDQIAALEAAQAVDPSDIETRYLLSAALLEKPGQSEQAKAQIVQIVNEFTPHEPKDYALLYGIYLGLADLDVSLENTEEALDWLKLAFDLPFVQTHQAAINMSRLYLDLERYDDAWAWQQQVAALRPSDPQTYTLAGDILEKQGNLADAAASYEGAVALMPLPRVITYNKLAQVYEKLGRAQEARQLWQRVLEIDPQNQKAMRALEK